MEVDLVQMYKGSLVAFNRSALFCSFLFCLFLSFCQDCGFGFHLLMLLREQAMTSKDYEPGKGQVFTA